jgi:hypothetical protein
MPEGLKFVATAFPHDKEKGKVDPTSAMIDDARKKGYLKDQKALTFKGMESTQIRVEMPGGSALMRMIKGKGVFYQMIVQWQAPTKLEDVEKHATRFFDSLALEE